MIATNCTGKRILSVVNTIYQIIQVTYKDTTKKYAYASKYRREGTPKQYTSLFLDYPKANSKDTV